MIQLSALSLKPQSPLPAIPLGEIKTQLGVLANNLLNVLESGDQAKALAAQEAFTGAITLLWNMAEEINIDPKTKAIFRLVAGWAMNELPKLIHDPANNAEIKRQLKLFQRSLTMFN
jgi:hypothetical protein